MVLAWPRMSQPEGAAHYQPCVATLEILLSVLLGHPLSSAVTVLSAAAMWPLSWGVSDVAEGWDLPLEAEEIPGSEGPVCHMELCAVCISTWKQHFLHPCGKKSS